MRLDKSFPPSWAAIIGKWPRFEIEDAIERLIEVLDTGDAFFADLEPDEEDGRNDGWAGDPSDAEG